MKVLAYYNYTSWGGDAYLLELVDAEATTGSAIETEGRGAKLSYEGDEELHPYTPILYSKLEAYFMVNDDLEAILVDLLQSPKEGRYYLRLFRFGSLEWLGVIQPEQIEWPRTAKPYEVAISATDGIKLLENKQVPVPDANSASFTTELIYILAQSGLQQFYGAGDTYVSIACEYYPQSTTASTGEDQLRISRMVDSSSLYLVENDDGDDKWTDLHTRLKDTLVTFGLRLCFNQGHYYILQVDAYSMESFRIHNYTKDFRTFNDPRTISAGSTSFSSYAPEKNINNASQELAGGTQSYTPVIRRVTTTLEDKRVISPRSVYASINNTVRIGNLLSTTSADSLMISLDVDLFTQASSPSDYPGWFDVVFTVTLKVGSYYYNPNGAGIWSTTASSFTVSRNAYAPGTSSASFAMSSNPGQPYIIYIWPLTVSGSIDLTITGRLEKNGQAVPNVSFGNTQGTVSARYSSRVNNDTVDVELGTNTDSSYTVKLANRKIIDNGAINTPGTLETFNLNTTTWEPPQTWSRFRPSTLQGTLSFLVLNAIYRRQQKPLQIFNIAIISEQVRAVNVLLMEGKRAILQRGEWDTETGEWSGSWIEIGTYDASVAPDENIRLPDPQQGIGTSSGTNNKFNKRTGKAQGSHLKVAYTSGTVSGTPGSISLASATGIAVGGTGDLVQIINPVTGAAETLELAAAWAASDSSISVNGSLSNTYPDGSLLTLSVSSLASRITALENAGGT